MKEESPSGEITFRSLILDMDGVLWRGTAPIGDLPAIFSRIRTRGFQFLLATNNATRSPLQYVEKLAAFGVEIESWQVVTSAVATASYLKSRFPFGGEIYTIGEEPLIKILEENGFNQGTQNPVAVVVALDRGINYQKLTEATLLIRSGVPFIGTNPDRSFPIPEGQAPGAGAILAALEAATGEKPVIIGKPMPQMYLVALERLGTAHFETLVVGDRLETDIQGAQSAGFPSALVLSGVTSPQEVAQWSPPPTFVAPDLAHLIDSLPPIHPGS
jgi:4-nitrophenyl phosphatase